MYKDTALANLIEEIQQIIASNWDNNNWKDKLNQANLLNTEILQYNLLLLLYAADVVLAIFVNAICFFTIVICLLLSKLWFCGVFSDLHF